MLLKVNGEDIYLVSAYFKPSENRLELQNHLDYILSNLQGRKVIIGVDANSRSAVWHDRLTDAEGRDMEKYIVDHNLYISNTSSDLTTFHSTSGKKSNIDLTLTTGNMIGRITGWKINDDLIITSDHNTITLKLNVQTNRNMTRNNRYNVGAANWIKFKEEIQKEYETNYWEHKNADETCELATNIITKCANSSIPYTRGGYNRTKWWNQTLDRKKKKVRKSRKQFQRANIETKNIKYIEYIRERAEYCAMIKKRKEDSFKSFIENDLQKNPWGTAQKIICNKIKINEIKREIKNLNQGHSLTIEESAKTLMDVIIPTIGLARIQNC